MQLASILGAVTMTDYVVHQLQPSMQDSPAKRPYSNPIASWRKNIAFAYQPIVLVLLLLSGPAFGYVWMKTSWREAGPLPVDNDCVRCPDKHPDCRPRLRCRFFWPVYVPARFFDVRYGRHACPPDSY